MKKFLIGAMALGCAVCCLALASGCKNEGSFSAQSYSCAGEEVRNVSVDVRDSAVEIAPSEDGTLRIEYYESESRTYGIALEGGTLSVSLVSEGGIGNFFGVQPDVGFRTLRLYVPDGLGTLAVTTTNEDITLASVSCTDSVSRASSNLSRSGNSCEPDRASPHFSCALSSVSAARLPFMIRLDMPGSALASRASPVVSSGEGLPK